jgi:hypothetical protein
MVETLLTPSSIKLFGRVMAGITIDSSTLGQSGYLGANKFLRHQLTSYNNSITVSGTATNGNVNLPVSMELDIANLFATLTNASTQIPVSDTTGGTIIPANTTCYVTVASGAVSLTLSNAATVSGKKPVVIPVVLQYSFPPTLARIYAFSFEGAFFQLPRPALFLVHGPGIPVGNWDNSPSTMDQAGVAGREWDFSGNKYVTDVVYWEYEKGDFSFRLDLEAGPFEQILLQMALRSGAGVSGAGVSGAGVSGAGVSGAGVSGAGVSGAGVSGAGVSGAGVRR